MLKPVRRVVTGHDAAGRSVVMSDDALEGPENKDWPGLGMTILWTSSRTPADNNGPAQSDRRVAFPGPNGTSFEISQIPPESELAAMPEERRTRVLSVARRMKGTLESDRTREPRMHATQSVDYLVVLSGELTLLLDEGEVTLKPFDTVIQRGTNHAWINRGSEPALLVSVVVGAEPLAQPTGEPL